MAMRSDPIAAIATPPGRGGIGIIRLSGPAELASLLPALMGRQALVPRHAHYLPFLDADGAAIDQGLALWFEAPHSYTGEFVLELQGHGGPMVLRRLLARCLDVGRAIGLRLAEPGEFTERAFLNDRLDLAQAEAVADLIDAASEAAARGAAASLQGVFSREVNALAERILQLRLLVEATLDFPEEEIDFLEKYQAAATLAAIRATLAAIRAQARQGALLRDGMQVVLAGPPNVGKSSLLNALAGHEAAIVTDIPGTTRDRVVEQLSIEGVPLHVIDTAGLRATEDAVERLGIERSWASIEKADVILHLHDATRPEDNDALQREILGRVPPRTPVLQVYNKIDLLADGGEALAAGVRDLASLERGGVLLISVRQDQGLDALRARLLELAGWVPGGESPYLARERHLQALAVAEEHLEMAAEHAAADDRVLDLFAEELRLAHLALGEITGQVTSDDLLGAIFSRFCIGK
ncbi:MAG: tRNA uridine-5-carboxymethylaminomethyl(34) synthesis GTPase MnmE [Pigmentiphaga sp.]|nr:tRNA uridine-5-carboxymethylaminomethyl(34) synthesis GTPase MnmE [Pigmentiphaga sp.]